MVLDKSSLHRRVESLGKVKHFGKISISYTSTNTETQTHTQTHTLLFHFHHSTQLRASQTQIPHTGQLPGEHGERASERGRQAGRQAGALYAVGRRILRLRLRLRRQRRCSLASCSAAAAASGQLESETESKREGIEFLFLLLFWSVTRRLLLFLFCVLLTNARSCALRTLRPNGV